jgi:hypothetical protein
VDHRLEPLLEFPPFPESPPSAPSGSTGLPHRSSGFSDPRAPVDSGGATPKAAGDSSTGVIVGSVIGALAAVVAIALIAMALLRRGEPTVATDSDRAGEMGSATDSIVIPTTGFSGQEWDNPQSSVITALTNFVPFNVFVDGCGEGI